jgi:hypothetical protein
MPMNHPLYSDEKSWWGPVWRGLVFDRKAQHLKAMKSALWLFLYCIVHADRRTGTLYRRLSTIASDMGIKERTLQHWLRLLRESGYVRTESNGRGIMIEIQKWKSISQA